MFCFVCDHKKTPQPALRGYENSFISLAGFITRPQADSNRRETTLSSYLRDAALSNRQQARDPPLQSGIEFVEQGAQFHRIGGFQHFAGDRTDVIKIGLQYALFDV